VAYHETGALQFRVDEAWISMSTQCILVGKL